MEWSPSRRISGSTIGTRPLSCVNKVNYEISTKETEEKSCIWNEKSLQIYDPVICISYQVEQNPRFLTNRIPHDLLIDKVDGKQVH